MVVAVVTLAVALTAGILGIVAMSRWLGDAMTERSNATRLYQDEIEVADRYKSERDEALTTLAATDSLYRAAKFRIASLERERNDAYVQGANDLAAKVRSGTAADAVAAIDQLLSARLAELSQAAGPGTQAGGVGGSGASAVQPATAAGSDALRRLP